jgi:hypothetical protein
MKELILTLSIVAVVGLLAGDAFAGAAGQDGGTGNPPNGFAFSDDSPGARVSGVIINEFRDIPLFTCNLGTDIIGAPTLFTTVRVRKAGKLAAFSHVLTCAGTNMCDSACQNFSCDNMSVRRLVSTGKIAEIQACVLEDLGSKIAKATIDDPDADVKLKNVEEFVGVPPVFEPPGTVSKSFVADIELSVK